MNAVCLFVAASLAATLPGPEFTLAWSHSVEKTRWVERFRLDGDALRLMEASVEGTGAGMEPPPEAVFAHGVWQWSPDRRVHELVLGRSGFTADYTICSAGHCDPMSRLAGPAWPGNTVTIRACEAPAR